MRWGGWEVRNKAASNLATGEGDERWEGERLRGERVAR